MTSIMIQDGSASLKYSNSTGMQGFHVYVTWILNIQRSPHYGLSWQKGPEGEVHTQYTSAWHYLPTSHYLQICIVHTHISGTYKTSPKHLKKVIYLRFHEFTFCGPVFATVPRNSPTAAGSGRVRLLRLHLCSRLDVPFLRLNATQLCAAPGLAGQDGWGLLRLRDCVREHMSVCACVCVCANVHCVNREVILFTHLGVRGGRRPPS